jgi:hypothetical protein
MKRLATGTLAFVISLATLVGLSIVPSNADDVCIGYSPGTAPSTPNWTVLDGPKMTFRVTWAIPDTNSCITGIDNGTSDPRRGPGLIKSPGSRDYPQTSWQLLRDNNFSILIATFEVPMRFIESSFAAQAFYYEAIDFLAIGYKYKGDNFANYGYGLGSLSGKFYWDDLWAIYFAKKQSIYSEECNIIESEVRYAATTKYLPDFSYRVESPGKSPTLVIDIADTRQCVHLVGVLPIAKSGGSLGTVFSSSKNGDEYFAHSGISLKASKEHVSLFVTNEIPKLRIAQGDFARVTPIPKLINSTPELHEILFPVSEVKHTDTVVRNSTRVTISSKLDLSAIDISKVPPESITGVYIGYYNPYTGTASCFSSRWSATYSGSTINIRYYKGGCLDPAQKYQYQTKYMQIPTLDLLYGVGKADSERKAAAELKAKQEAEAKAAAELKAKQEADAKAAAELKAKQEADAKAAAELKAKQEADAKAAAELKAKQEAEAKAQAEAQAREAAANAEAEAAAKAAAKKNTTITCVKGKLTKKVTAVKPVCPKGYKKK